MCLESLDSVKSDIITAWEKLEVQMFIKSLQQQILNILIAFITHSLIQLHVSPYAG